MASKTYQNQTKQNIDKLYEKLYPLSESEKQPPYTYWQLKVNKITYTAYKSGKVLVQGKDLKDSEQFFNAHTDLSYATSLDSKNIYPQAGSDEAGCGDYLGPIVVGACIVKNKQTADYLIEHGLRDSKELSDAKILELDTIIRKKTTITVITLSPEKYNKWISQGMNLVDIKCRLHKMAWEDLQKKGSLPGQRIIDGFCNKDRFMEAVESTTVKNLQFISKADAQYVSVMCGAILARAAYLREMERLEYKWNTILAKGADVQADESAVRFIHENSFEDLPKVAKMNFANTRKVKVLSGIFKPKKIT